MQQGVAAAIAIGSNLGDRAGHVEFALARLGELRETALLACGPVIETQPVARPGAGNVAAGAGGVEGDPAEGLGGPFLNTAVMVRTTLSPRELLCELHAIEAERGRVRSASLAWMARTLDLDLLVYGDWIVRSAGSDALVLPHPRMHERRFVLEPLACIAPDLLVAGLNRTVRELLDALDRAQPHGRATGMGERMLR